MIVSIIAAYRVADRAIGANGDLPWRLPADMAHFRRLTMGHTLIMGRRTFESLAGRSLPGRRIVLLSSGIKVQPIGVEAVATSLEEALAVARFRLHEEETFIGGGGSVYQRALELGLVDRMYLTLVEAPVDPAADTYFPTIDSARWQVTSVEHRPADERNPHAMTFQTLERVDDGGSDVDEGV